MADPKLARWRSRAVQEAERAAEAQRRQKRLDDVAQARAHEPHTGEHIMGVGGTGGVGWPGPASPRAVLAEHKREIEALAGENLAMHAMVAHLCRALVQHDPSLREPIAKAFDGATMFMAFTRGKSVSSEHTCGAIRLLDHLRDTALEMAQPSEDPHGGDEPNGMVN